jgi:hypothetical protein
VNVLLIIGVIPRFADIREVSEKRSEPRIPLMARIDVLWADDGDVPRVAPASLEDKSHGGMSVRMQSSISVGTYVTIKWGDQEFTGVVTNCRREKNSYILGVQRGAGEGRG